MKAMVLAAGQGTRLKPFTETVPKPMFPVLGVPVIEWALRNVKRAGAADVAINLHHLPAAIVRHLSSGRELGLNLTYSEEPILLGTGGALSAMRGFFEGEDFFVVHNGDVFTDWDLAQLVERHLGSGAQATLALVDDPKRPKAQLVELDGDAVVGIRGDPQDHGGPKYMFSGVSVLSGAVFDHLPQGEVSCLVQQGLVPMIRDGLDVRGVVMDGLFCDIGTPERYLNLQWELMGRMPGLFVDLDMKGPVERPAGVFRIETSEVAADAVLEPPAIVCAGARVEAGARVGPRAVICDNATVKSGVVIRDAVVFPGAVARNDCTGIVGNS
ncbi:MAG: NDP-sugar synthase [Deltaproteobacteria bacterium]|nr:NDP-sugar synthase [Deltaproteobacteria bacterium]